MRGNGPRLFGPAVIVSNTGRSVRVLKAFSEQVIEDMRRAGRRPVEGRAVRYADIPINVAVRCRVLEEAPRQLQARLTEKVWVCSCCLEAGVPEAWCAPLPPVGAERSIHRAIVACSNMVEDRRE